MRPSQGGERRIYMKITKGFIIGLIGGILTILATILPWSSGPGIGESPMDVMGAASGFGTVVLIIGVIGIILAYLSRGILTMIFGVLALLVTFIWVGALSYLSSWFVSFGGTNSVGYGTYIAIVGAILLILGGIIIHEENKAAVASA